MSLTLAQFAMMGGDYPSSFGQSGYMKFPNGLILQWGLSGGSGNSSGATVTFPIAFPNNCFNVVACNGYGPTAISKPNVGTLTKTNFNLGCLYVNNGVTNYTTDSNTWFAIGN